MTVSLRLRVALAATFLLFTVPVFAAPFSDNGDGTVTDDATGLVWDRCTWGQIWNGTTCLIDASWGDAYYEWSEALGLAITANAGSHRGRDDWRLPNRTELNSLVDLSINLSATLDGTAFPNTPTDWYWTSTTYVPEPYSAWYVSFSNGDSMQGAKGNGGRVRLVSGGGALFGAYDAQPQGDPAAIPTLSQWAAILLMLGLAGIGFRVLRRPHR